MKLTITQTNKFALLSAAVCAVMLAFSQNASALPIPMPATINLTIGDGHELGFVEFGIPSGDSDRLNYVNHLIGMAPAVLTGLVNGTSTSIDLGAGGTYLYLFAKYDGPNYGSEVWYVGDLSGI